MATDNALVSNSYISSNPDLPVRSTANTTGKLLQHVRIDVGDGTAESQVTALNPLPVSGTVSVTGGATEATLLVVSGNVADIETLVGTTNTTLATISGNVDGVEALIGTTNSTLATISTNVDGVETLIGTTNTTLATTNTTLSTISTNVNDIETLVGTTNSTLATINTNVDGIETLIGTTNSTLATISGNVDGVETLIGTTNTTLGTISTTASTISTTASTISTTATTISGNVVDIENLATTISTNVNDIETLAGTINTNVSDIETLANTMSTKLAASGTSAIKVQGAVATGAATSGTAAVPIAFQDIFGNSVIPTGINASGFTVMGVWPLDGSLNFQDFTASGEIYATGFVANDAVDSGNPIKVGGKAITNNDGLTAVASADRTNLTTDRRNRLIIDSDRMLVASATLTTGSGVTTLIAAPGAGLKSQVYKIHIAAIIESNNSIGSSESEGVYFRFGASAFAAHSLFTGTIYDSTNKEVWGIPSPNHFIDFSPAHWDGGANEAFQVALIGLTLGNTYSFYVSAWYRTMPT